MELSTLLLAATMTVLPLIGAGLVATMVLLERPGRLAPVPAAGPASRRSRRSQPRRRR